MSSKPTENFTLCFKNELPSNVLIHVQALDFNGCTTLQTHGPNIQLSSEHFTRKRWVRRLKSLLNISTSTNEGYRGISSILQLRKSGSIRGCGGNRFKCCIQIHDPHEYALLTKGGTTFELLITGDEAESLSFKIHYKTMNDMSQRLMCTCTHLSLIHI